MTADAARRIKGEVAYLSGQAAENAVAAHYQRAGNKQLAARWRGSVGELDLVFENETKLIFVEVKKSKSIAGAAAHLGSRQIVRLLATAQEYLGHRPDGLLTDVRFDVALVDAIGEIKVIENAIGEG